MSILNKGPKLRPEEGGKLPPGGRVAESWGWAASAARFRGVLVLLLGLTLAGSVVTNMMVLSRSQVFLAVTKEGRPEMLEEANRGVDYQVFCRDFINGFFSYTPSTIEEGLNRALRMSTQSFSDAFKEKLGLQYIQSVKTNNVTQIQSVSRVEISSMDSTGFVAVATTTRLRSDGTTRRTTEDNMRIRLEVVKGPVTKNNPWGYYVNSVAEESF